MGYVSNRLTTDCQIFMVADKSVHQPVARAIWKRSFAVDAEEERRC